MDAAKILADVQLALSVAKQAAELGKDAGPSLLLAWQIAFGHKKLTLAERTAMQEREIAMRNAIDDAIEADDASG